MMEDKMQKFTLMMLTCDKYSDIWPAYFGQLRKYWPQYTGEIFVNTESKRVEGTGIKNIISYPTTFSGIPLGVIVYINVWNKYRQSM
jgi:hypothetical protein